MVFMYLISKLRRIYIPSCKLVSLYSQHFSIANVSKTVHSGIRVRGQ